MALPGAGVALVAVVAWLVAGLLQRDDPAHPPATIDWHSWASAYRSLQLEHVGDDGGLPLHGLPLGLDSP